MTELYEHDETDADVGKDSADASGREPRNTLPRDPRPDVYISLARKPRGLLLLWVAFTALALFFVFNYLKICPDRMAPFFGESGKRWTTSDKTGRADEDDARLVFALFTQEPKSGRRSATLWPDPNVRSAALAFADKIDETSFARCEPFGLDAESCSDSRIWFFSKDQLAGASSLAQIAAALKRGDANLLTADRMANRIAEENRAKDSSDVEPERARAFAEALQYALRGEPVAFDVPKDEFAPRDFPSKRALENGKDAALVAVRVAPGVDATDELERIMTTVLDASEIADEVKGGLFGFPIWEEEIAAGLKPAAFRVAIFGLGAAFLLGLVVFGSPLRALLLTLAPATETLWILGVVALLNSALGGLGISPDSARAVFLASVVALALAAATIVIFDAAREKERSASQAAAAAMRRAAPTVWSAVALLVLIAVGLSLAGSRLSGFALCAGALALAPVLIAGVVAPLVLTGELRPFAKRPVMLDMARWFAFASERPKRVAWGAVVLLAVALAGCGRLLFEPTECAFIPKDSPANVAASVARSDFGYNPAMSAKVAPDPGANMTEVVSRLVADDAGRAEPIDRLIPDPEVGVRARISEICDALKGLEPERYDVRPPAKAALESALRALIEALEGNGRDPSAVATAHKMLAELDPETAAPLLENFQRAATAEELRRIFTLREIATPEPPGIEQLSDKFQPLAENKTILAYPSVDLRTNPGLEAFCRNAESLGKVAGVAADLYASAKRRIFLSLVILASCWALACLPGARKNCRFSLTAPTFALTAFFGIAAYAGFPLNAIAFCIPLTAVVVCGLASILYSGAAFRSAREDGFVPDRPLWDGGERGLATAFAFALIVAALSLSGCLSLPEEGWRLFARLGVLSLICAAAGRLVAAPTSDLDADHDERDPNAAEPELAELLGALDSKESFDE